MTTIDEFRSEYAEYVALAADPHTAQDRYQDEDTLAPVTNLDVALRGLHRLENTIRGIAWSATGRAAARELVAEIRAEIERICQEHDLVAPSQWSFEDVVAGGPEHRINYRGYSR